jgi:hypothetical protein
MVLLKQFAQSELRLGRLGSGFVGAENAQREFSRVQSAVQSGGNTFEEQR